MLGDKLKSYRLSRHLTQDDVATALNLTIRRISSYESGEAEPDLYTLADLADFYEISLDDLMDRQSPPLPTQMAIAYLWQNLGIGFVGSGRKKLFPQKL